MKTIKTILAVTILFFTVQTGFAQKVKKGNPYLNKVIEFVQTKASLSDAETTGVKEILVNLSKTKNEIKKNTELSKEDKKAKNKEMFQNRNKSLNTLLGKIKSKAVIQAIAEFQKSQKKK